MVCSPLHACPLDFQARPRPSVVLCPSSYETCYGKYVCYLDDIIVFAKTPQELLDRLHQVFTRLAEVGLKVKPSKTVLFKTEIGFLGHLVTAQGVNPMPDKLQAIRDWPTPHCLRDVRAFFGLASYYRNTVEIRGLYPHLFADDTQIYGSCSPEESQTLMDRMSACISDVDKWMQSNRLQLKVSKRGFV